MSENVNFNFLKNEFISKYNNNAEKSGETNDSDNSIIFSHEEEFKKYIQDETGCDSSVFSFGIDEISKMKFEDGKFINPNQTSDILNDENLKLASDFSNFMLDELNSILSESTSLSAVDLNNDGKISASEANNYVQNIDSNNDNNLDFDELASEALSYGDDGNLDEKTKEEINQNHILDKILSIENGKNVLTVDEYGQVTEESKKKFLDYIKDYSDDGDEVTEADLKRAWDDIQSGKFSYDTDLSQRRKEIEEEIELDTKNGEKNAEENRNTFSNANNENSVDNMNYDELYSARDKKAQEVDNANDRLQAVQNYTYPSIVSAQEMLDNAYQVYQDELAEKEKLEKEREKLTKALAKLQQGTPEYNRKKDELESLNSKLTGCLNRIKDLSKDYQDAQTNYNAVYQDELKSAQRNLEVKQNQLKNIDNEIALRDTNKAVFSSSNYKGQFDFDFSLNLSSRQQNELELFKKTWTEHESQYREVEAKTGLPAELIAAIHWRESGGNFNTYLHNGDPLGKTTTHVPKGVYFTDWTAAAVDAIKNYGGNLSNVNVNDINTWYDYAERYNGLGYRKKGVPSPYVWAGTSNYKCGKYVADGKYNPNYVDQQLGVAVMLQALTA